MPARIRQAQEKGLDLEHVPGSKIPQALIELVAEEPAALRGRKTAPPGLQVPVRDKPSEAFVE